MLPNAPPSNGSPLLPDDAVLGGLLLLGSIPNPLRLSFRPDLFVPQRQPLARALLVVSQRLGACPLEAVKEEMAVQGAGMRDMLGVGAVLDAGALPDELPDLLDALAYRAQRRVATEAPTPVALSEVLDGLLEQMKSGPPKCIPTPFPTLNHFLAGGFAPGELIYIGAAPGVGKSALAIELARHAGKAGHRVLVVSREMLNVALARRMLAQEARVRATALKTGRIGAGEWVLLESALQRLRGLPVWMTEQAISLGHIEGMAHAFPPPLDLLIVDYLQLLQAPAGIEDIRLQVQAVSVGLKRLAVALHMPVICLSSLSRQGDLKESSSLDHDGDILLFLHREEDSTETQCRLRKNRDGETGKTVLRFRKEYVTFEEPSDRQEE